MKIPVRIVSIRQETPTVRSYTLDLEGQAFSFHPGQWVDCYVDAEGERGVAGYTLTSSPTTVGTIELTVKRNREREVTRFMHEEAETGDVIYVDGGQGEFYYKREMGDSLTLIAGGIGITPLMSMLRYVDEGTSDVGAKLFYSARAPSEMVFHRQLEDISGRNPRVDCVFTVTRPGGEPWEGHRGRIDDELLRAEGVDMGGIFFICGPKPMGQDMEETLKGLGVAEERIRYEQWW
ncbi:oxidoreductase [Candidatus Bathyarchaeota archaeon]|nr:oxidoreductase [Candidatus Bathyarchaeota archaeon]MBL7168292.1 oxidoreductase [Candidatus Bathyarchaeota archaeon]